MAARQIFIVNAVIVDSNGTFNVIEGYPKNFDSRSYGNDIAKTKKRALGAAAEIKGVFAKRDDRQMQVVSVITADGFVVETWVDGAFAEVETGE